MSIQLARSLLLSSPICCAGFVKGVIGMGLPTVALGMLAAVMAPAQAAAILIAPSLATNIWQMVAGPYLLRPGASGSAPMLVGMYVGAWLGAGILTGVNAKPAAIGLGVVLIVYAVTRAFEDEILGAARTKSGSGRSSACPPVM